MRKKSKKGYHKWAGKARLLETKGAVESSAEAYKEIGNQVF